MRHLPVSLFLLTLLFFQCASPEPDVDPAYREAVETWRAERVAELTAPDGWMSLAGLYWLEEGENTFGSAEGNALVFPVKAPARVGSFFLQKDSVWMTMAEGVTVTTGDSAVTGATLRVTTEPRIFSHGTLSWFLIERGGKYGIRLRDAENEHIESFSGIDYFPLDPDWRVPARFIPYTEPETILVRNILDMNLPYPTEGEVVFEKEGQTHALQVLDGGPEEYFLIFADLTSGEETYGGGRYLYAPRADSTGRTVLDFNKAYNPPCAFTAYATCLLPPAGNWLGIEVEAGERVESQKSK